MIATLLEWAKNVFNAFNETATDTIDLYVVKNINKTIKSAKGFIQNKGLTHTVNTVKNVVKCIMGVAIGVTVVYQMIYMLPMFAYFIPTYIAFTVLTTLSNKIVHALI